jgi:glycosyltransferase involved in cell wall biosynthesis
MEIDVVIPTYESGPVIEETINSLHASVNESGFKINRIINIDNNSGDGTVNIIKQKCNEFGWSLQSISGEYNLPQARQKGINLVKKDWFLFIDDDVRIRKEYLANIKRGVCELGGGIQGKKASENKKNSDWVRRRSRRGGTHATLIRKEAIDDITLPEDLVVLEDEYIRQYIESNGYLWIFNHQSVFQHDRVGRHPTGFNEGYVAGKYDLMKPHRVFLSIPKALLRINNPSQQVIRAIGWLLGNFRSCEEHC